MRYIVMLVVLALAIVMLMPMITVVWHKSKQKFLEAMGKAEDKIDKDE